MWLSPKLTAPRRWVTDRLYQVGGNVLVVTRVVQNIGLQLEHGKWTETGLKICTVNFCVKEIYAWRRTLSLTMPFWRKIFNKKSVTIDDTNKSKNDGRRGTRTTEIEELCDSPVGEKRNFNYNLSVSRSGRYKSKERKRAAILEDPEFFGANNTNNTNNTNTSVASNDRTAVACGNRGREVPVKITNDLSSDARPSQKSAAT